MKCETIYVVSRIFADDETMIEAFKHLEDADDAAARHRQAFVERGFGDFDFIVTPILLY